VPGGKKVQFGDKAFAVTSAFCYLVACKPRTSFWHLPLAKRGRFSPYPVAIQWPAPRSADPRRIELYVATAIDRQGAKWRIIQNSPRPHAMVAALFQGSTRRHNL